MPMTAVNPDAVTSDDNPPGARAAGPYANPASRRKVDLPSLINLLLGAGDAGHEAPARRDDDLAAERVRPTAVDLGAARGRIDWGHDPDALRRGDLGALAPDVAALIRAAARTSAIAAYAKLWGIAVTMTVIAIIAASEAKSNRFAERLARAILTEAAAGEIEMALRDVGLH
jgi:hypothetical protein